MGCPVCDNGLTDMMSGGIVVDACEGGCGGLWFDRYELMRVDEAHESAGEGLLEIERDEKLVIDFARRLRCPKDGVVMMRHFSSAKRQVTVDECPECGGHWLDPGELAGIRTEFASEVDREQAAQKHFSELFDIELAAAHAVSEKELERARKISHVFRFLSPSYYVPGKQDWGAF